MEVTFLGQGYESVSENSVGKLLIKFLGDAQYSSFTAIAAFASEAGVNGLIKYITAAQPHLKSVTVIVGIDKKATSQEALIALLSTNSYIFYQQPDGKKAIFHPKIYLFEGKEKSELIIGSSNLTSNGLFANVEASLLINIDNRKETDTKIIRQLKDYFKGLFDLTDPNLQKLSKKLIEGLAKEKVISTEAERKAMQEELEKVSQEEIPDSVLKLFPRRITGKIPVEFRGLVKKKEENSKGSSTHPEPKAAEATLGAKTLVWHKKNLPQSDAQRVPTGTAITGNVTLSQAKFKVNGKVIDQKTYFRNDLFGALEWITPASKKIGYEEAFCEFNVVILGKDLGLFKLKLSHDMIRVAGQGNTPTWLHWGETLVSYLRKDADIKKHTLNLSQLEDHSFQIEIV